MQDQRAQAVSQRLFRRQTKASQSKSLRAKDVKKTQRDVKKYLDKQQTTTVGAVEIPSVKRVTHNR